MCLLPVPGTSVRCAKPGHDSVQVIKRVTLSGKRIICRYKKGCMMIIMILTVQLVEGDFSRFKNCTVLILKKKNRILVIQIFVDFDFQIAGCTLVINFTDQITADGGIGAVQEIGCGQIHYFRVVFRKMGREHRLRDIRCADTGNKML